MGTNRKRRKGAESWLIKSTLLAPFACTPLMVHAQDAVADAEASSEEAEPETVIVTGTRASGLDAYTSSSPVQVLGATEIQSAGRTDLMSALANVVPSFTAQAFGGDMANQTLQAKLRGLSPNHTLVLVNGKRRHTTASLAILGGPYQGGAGVDLNFIPVDSIDHVEVLTEGAAAQYGTDAIAGVINIITKKKPQGGSLTVSNGAHYAGDGATGSYSGNIGFEAMSGSYINVAAEYREHEHTNRGDIDPRVVDPARIDPDAGGTFPNTNMPFAPGYPYLNKIFGDAAYEIKLVSINAGMPSSATTPSSTATATWGYKHAASFENYRLPSRVAYKDPDTEEMTYFRPFGFNPREETEETDFPATLGCQGRGRHAGTGISLRRYGKDEIDMFTRDSANASLFAATGQTPTNFYDGTYTRTQWTSNLDVDQRDSTSASTAPMNFAFGAEYRKETWEASPGDAASRYFEGGQSFPGISTSDSGSHDRDVTARICQLRGPAARAAAARPRRPIRGLQRLRRHDRRQTQRAIRGDGYLRAARHGRARVSARRRWRSPTTRRRTSVRRRRSCRCRRMRPPRRCSDSARDCSPRSRPTTRSGFVFRPERAMSLTFDLYQVEVRNRIAGTSTFYGTIDGELFSRPSSTRSSPTATCSIRRSPRVAIPASTCSPTASTTRDAWRRPRVRLHERHRQREGRLERVGDLQRDGSDQSCATRRRSSAPRSRCSTSVALADLDGDRAELPGEPGCALRVGSPVVQRARARLRQVGAIRNDGGEVYERRTAVDPHGTYSHGDPRDADHQSRGVVRGDG